MSSSTTKSVTVFKNIDWLVAWDEANASHRYLRNAHLAIEGDLIIYLGKEPFQGEAHRTVDASRAMIMPGLVNIHCHTPSSPMFKGRIEDMGNPNFWNNKLYEGIGLFMVKDAKEQAAASRLSLAEMLLAGTTTCLDMEYPEDDDEWIGAFVESGVRGIISPIYASSSVDAISNSKLTWTDFADGGKASWERAIRTYEYAEAYPSDLITSMLAPNCPDLNSPEQLRDTMDFARQKGCKVHMHAAMSPSEFHEMIRRNGRTPIQTLFDQGVLGPDTIIGHGVIVDNHSWVNWHTRDDIALMGQTGTSLSHCPTVYARDGYKLESYRRYRKAGVTIGLGTDACPFNMIEEMRSAVTIGRISDGDMYAVSTADVFNAATVDGARAIGRDDIGRLAVGKKADLVVVDIDNDWMKPLYDPIRSMIYHAAERAVKDVYVNGRQVVADGELLTMDRKAITAELTRIADENYRRAPERDRRGRGMEEISPHVFDVV